ncbi:MAG: phage tail tape measure protein [Burkholderiales bacterium]|nr:phage tail tape measure protein [Burkholderiales bacterium]
MAIEEVGIRITADGVYEAASGLKLTTAEVGKLGDMLRKSSKDANEFEKAQEAASAATGDLTKKAVAVGAAIGTMAGQFIVNATGRLYSLARSGIDSAAALGVLSERSGIAVERIGGLEYAAKLSDTSLASLVGGLSKLNKVLFEANRGKAQAQDTFRALGIDPKTLGDSQSALLAVADAFSRIQDSGAKSALARRLGLSEDLIPFLNRGATAVRELVAEGERLNPITSESAAAARRFTDEMAKLGVEFTAWTRQIGTSVLPTLNRWSEQMREGTRLAGGFWSAIWKFGTANPFRSAGESAQAYRKEIEQLERRIKTAPTAFARGTENRAALQARLAETRQQYEFAKLLERQEIADRYSGGVSSNEGRGREINQEIVDKLPKVPKGKSDAEREFERAMSEASRLQSTGGMFASAGLVKFRDEVSRSLQEVQRLDDEYARSQQRAQQETERQTQTLRDQAQAWRERSDPVEQYRRQMEEISLLMSSVDKDGNPFLSQEEGFKAQVELQRQIGAQMKITKDAGLEGFRELKQAVEGWGKAASASFVDWAFGAKTSIRDVVATMLKEFATLLVYKNIMGPLFNAAAGGLAGTFGGMFGGGGAPGGGTFRPSAYGNAFEPRGAITAFANGGVVSRPTFFNYVGGRGVLGEKAPEAILPLERGPDNRLGVTARGLNLGGGGTTVNVSIVVNAAGGAAPAGSVSGDSAGLELGRSLERSVRGWVRDVLMQEQRPGGLLAA